MRRDFAFLQTMRDRLTVDQAAELGAQLPMLVRGIYYEDAVLPPSREPLAAIKAAAGVLRRHLTEGETEDLLRSIPQEIRRLLE